MRIDTQRTDDRLLVAVEGRLDAVSSPQFEEQVVSLLDGVAGLTLDMGKVEYLSSAGLRALLYLQQIMNEQGSMAIRNVPDIVMDIFEVTGFLEIMTVE